MGGNGSERAAEGPVRYLLVDCPEWDRLRESMESSGMGAMMVGAGLVCCLLGLASLTLNAIVVLTLCRHTHTLRKNVFYLIALHCGVVDFLRGLCLILWCVPFILDSHVDFPTRIRHTRMKQQVSLLLKALNLLTIFNLFLFTINEFIVINRPIRHRHIFRRQIVKGLLVLSWVMSLLLCASMFFLRKMGGSSGVFVTTNATDVASGVTITRTKGRGGVYLPLQYVFIFFIMSICYVCLLTVLVCYGSILNTIRKFRATEAGGLLDGSNFRCVSGPNVQRKMSNLSQPGNLAPNTGVSRKASLQIPLRYGAMDRPKVHKLSETEALRRPCPPPRPSVPTTTCGSPLTPTPRPSNFSRHIRQYLMNRHKYIMVIGMVLLVDVLYLLPYSIIQILSFLHLNEIIGSPAVGSVAARWLLQILIGLHAVCQPICYFRMNEFRRLICREKKYVGPSRMSSQANGLETILRAQPTQLLRQDTARATAIRESESASFV